MPSFSTTILLVFTAIIGGASAYIFFFGLPPQLKREMQEAALETIGENKASYALQQGLNKVPDSQSKVRIDAAHRDVVSSSRFLILC